MTAQDDQPGQAPPATLIDATMIVPNATVVGGPTAPPGAGGATVGQHSVLIGARLNDLFEIVRFIAHGGMGEVYEGRNTASGERVAIKIILPQYASDEQFFSLFRREAGALEKLAHIALVKYRALAFDRGLGLYYMAMEYVEGISLDDRLNGQPANSSDVVRLAHRMAQGLAAAHEVGIIHRDLSPDNVLLPDGDLHRAKIIDFGITKDTQAAGKSIVGDNFAGKLGYAAPEVFGEFGGKVGPWTDVYSLGLVVLALAKGNPVDMGNTIVSALAARKSVPDLAFLGPPLRPIFARMLAPDPANRYQSMGDILADLDRLPPAAQDGSYQTGGKGGMDNPASTRARRRRLVFAAAAGLVALAGVAALMLRGPTAPPSPIDAGAGDAGAGDAGGARRPWPEARAQVMAALAALSCSDVRVSGEPVGDTIALAGWHATGDVLPASLQGWKLDQSRLGSVPAPSPETCQIVAQIRRAAGNADPGDFAMPGFQSVSNSAVPAGRDTVPIDLHLSGRPDSMPALLLASIDDRPAAGEERVLSGNAAQFDLSALPFERKVKRYLIVMIAGRHLPRPLGWPVDASALDADCAGDACAVVSGWIDVTR